MFEPRTNPHNKTANAAANLREYFLFGSTLVRIDAVVF